MAPAGPRRSVAVEGPTRGGDRRVHRAGELAGVDERHHLLDVLVHLSVIMERGDVSADQRVRRARAGARKSSAGDATSISMARHVRVNSITWRALSA